MCIIQVVVILLYAGLALGPLLLEILNENCRDSSGKEDKKQD